MDYYGTAGSGEKHDEYHRPLPEPQAQPPHQAPQAREVHEGVVLPSPNSGGGQWTPPPVHEAATQMLPPYPAFQPPGAPSGPAAPAPGDAEATQYLPPQPPAPAPGSGDAEATQYLPPQPPAPGPAQGPGQVDESTTVLRQVRGAAPGAAPADATQRLPRFEDAPAQPPFAAQAPQAPQGYGQQPPPQNDFAHLYRQEGPPPAAPQAPQPPQAAMFQGYYEDEEPPRKKLSTGVLVGIVVGGCALVGLLAGAVLSWGGDDDTNTTVSGAAASASAGGSPSAAASASTDDAAKQQAVQLDALLKESGTSRSSVVQAVADIKACQNLGSAASDLRAAADQRNDLVSRLGQLPIDKLADHQALGAALNRAWKASAAADTHYAAWADQVAGKKGCKGGQARVTGQTAQGNAESGTATQAKKTAVRLWNAIADEYGLTRRNYTQL